MHGYDVIEDDFSIRVELDLELEQLYITHVADPPLHDFLRNTFLLLEVGVHCEDGRDGHQRHQDWGDNQLAVV